MTLLRQLRTIAHLQTAVARLLAADITARAAQEAEAIAEKTRRDNEMRSYLAQLKEEQDAERA